MERASEFAGSLNAGGLAGRNVRFPPRADLPAMQPKAKLLKIMEIEAAFALAPPE
jgi:hypothetical protein